MGGYCVQIQEKVHFKHFFGGSKKLEFMTGQFMYIIFMRILKNNPHFIISRLVFGLEIFLQYLLIDYSEKHKIFVLI